MSLSELFDEIPEGAIDEFGVRFSETKLFEYYSEAQVFPEDAVIAIRKLSTMSFLSKTELCYTKHPRNNKFTLIFDFKDKKKNMRISFPNGIDPEDKHIIKAILINPVPMNIERRAGRDGGMEPTGTGEKIFDYTIFNGVGFLETIQRNAEQKARKEFH